MKSDVRCQHVPRENVLFGFTLVIKLRNFNIHSHRNTLIFFDQNSVKQCLIWFKLLFKRILNFIEIASLFSIKRYVFISKFAPFFFLFFFVLLVFFGITIAIFSN